MSRTKPVDVHRDPGRDGARRRQELRRSNAARPIPAAKHKRPRAAVRQALRQEYAR